VKHHGPGVETQPEVYVPQSQSPQRGMYLALRASCRRKVCLRHSRSSGRTERRHSISNLATEERRFADLVQRPRFLASLLTCFAVLALALAIVGTFGVAWYSICQRTREFGIRFSLGAQKRDVIRLVLGRILRMVAAGIAVGLRAPSQRPNS